MLYLVTNLKGVLMAPKIENVKDIAARVRFLDQEKYTGMCNHAKVRVDFEKKINHHGVGSDHPLWDFAITASLREEQIGDDPSYGWSFQYENVFNVSLDKAKMMYEFMAWVNRRLNDSYNKIGRPLTFGQFVVRLLGVLGVDEGLVQSGREAHDVIIYDTIGELVYPIDERIRQKNADWFGAKHWYPGR
jgi:hypothetical protein